LRNREITILGSESLN